MKAANLVSWTLLLAAAFAATAGSARAVQKTASLQCTAIGMGDVILIRARSELALSGRRTFDVFFEAKPGRAFKAGQRMTVLVAGTKVDTVKLKPIVGGDVALEMQFDNAGQFGTRTKPFPDGFPDIARNTRVAVATGGKPILSCRLE
jgi:hypothetical protein